MFYPGNLPLDRQILSSAINNLDEKWGGIYITHND